MAKFKRNINRLILVLVIVMPFSISAQIESEFLFNVVSCDSSYVIYQKKSDDFQISMHKDYRITITNMSNQKILFKSDCLKKNKCSNFDFKNNCSLIYFMNSNQIQIEIKRKKQVMIILINWYSDMKLSIDSIPFLPGYYVIDAELVINNRYGSKFVNDIETFEYLPDDGYYNITPFEWVNKGKER